MAPVESTNPQRSTTDVAHVLEHLATCKPFNPDSNKGRVPKALGHASTRLNLLGLSMLISFVLLGLVIRGAGEATGWLKVSILVVGQLLIPMVGVMSLICTTAADLLHALEMRKHQGRNWANSYNHDAAQVETLSVFPLNVLKTADAWFEQKIKRVERRQIRFFGGNDKLALFTLIAAGWASWKEVNGLIQGVGPSWLLFGLAFIAGMTLGGLALSHQWERMGYLRDLLTLAIKRSEAATAE
jgi:hypothetical protein